MKKFNQLNQNPIERISMNAPTIEAI
jgi:hypothetical protein